MAGRTGADDVELALLFARLAEPGPFAAATPYGWLYGVAPPQPVPGRRARRAVLATLGVSVLALTAQTAAQSLDQYFPTTLNGYNTRFDTVTSRDRTEYDPLGIRAGGFLLSPEVSQSIGYDSNPTATPRPHGSGIADTEASVTANSTWSRHSLGAFAAVDQQTYLGQSNQSHADFRVAGTGQLDVGGAHPANAALTYLDLHQTADQLNALSAQQPLHYSVADLRASYLSNLGKLALLPSLEASRYRFDDVVIAGSPFSQSFRSRDVVQGGVTASYAFAPGQSAVLAGNAVSVEYTSNPAGQPSRDSVGGSLLAGLDYSTDDIFRYRVLAGVQHRSFNSPAYKNRTAPIVQADVVWQATALTTLTGSLSRAIEDASDESVIGYTDTQARLTVDHEYARNILLQGRLSFDHAEYLQNGGHASLFGAGASVTWRINRTLRVTASTDAQLRTGRAGNDFVRDISLIRVQAQL